MKRMVFQSILPLCLAALASGCGESSEERLARADAGLASNRFADARAELQAALRDDPENAEAMDKLARVYLQLGDPVAAIGMLDRMAAARKQPDDAPELYGEGYVMMGRFDLALGRVEDRQGAAAHRVRALAHIGRRETELAAEAFAAGMRAPGAKGPLLADYAGFLMEQGDLDQAERIAARAVAEKPAVLPAMLVNADLAVARGKPEEALSWFERALETFPESRAALFGKLAALGQMKRIDELRPLLKQALKDHPGELEFVFLEARLAAETAQWGKVREILQPFEGQMTGSSQASLLYSKALIELGHAEEVRVKMLSQLLREPGNRGARALLAEAQLATGDAATAIDTIRPLAESPEASAAERALLTQALRVAAGGA